MEDKETNTENVVVEEKKGIFKKNREDELKEKISILEGELSDSKNQVLIAKAELQNYRKRKDEEVSKTLRYYNADVLLEIINVIDDFERAIKLDNEIIDDEISKFLSGFKMIYTKLIGILDANEVKEIDSLNKPFDPMLHEAMLTTKVDGVTSGIVLEVYNKGYMYKDRVLRHAKVRVSE